MRWLVHGSISPAAVAALVRHGHTSQTLADVQLPEDAGLVETLEVAHKKQLDVLTTDKDLVQAPFDHGFSFGRSIVFLRLPGGEVEQDDAIERLFKRYKRLTPGQLYTVTESRVKVRQLPGA